MNKIYLVLLSTTMALGSLLPALAQSTQVQGMNRQKLEIARLEALSKQFDAEVKIYRLANDRTVARQKLKHLAQTIREAINKLESIKGNLTNSDIDRIKGAMLVLPEMAKLLYTSFSGDYRFYPLDQDQRDYPTTLDEFLKGHSSVLYWVDTRPWMIDSAMDRSYI